MWPTFQGFVAEWVRTPSEVGSHIAADYETRRSWWRCYWKMAGLIALLSFVLPLLLLCLATAR
ncbi:MAG TPA: hypothetical protein VGE74_06910 [Gemmata sp.]